MNWDNITKDEKVKQLLIKRISIEQEIKRLDQKALINYELEALNIPDVVGQSEQLKKAEQEGYIKGWEEGSQYGYSAACEGR